MKIPLLITSYRRVDTLIPLINQLLEYKDLLDIRVYSDAASIEDHEEEVKSLRSQVEKLPINLISREVNYGLVKNHDLALDECFSNPDVGLVIHLEEDIVLSKDFIPFILKSYEFYKDDPEVVGIQGFRLPFFEPDPIIFIQRDWGSACAYFRRGYESYPKNSYEAYRLLEESGQVDNWSFCQFYQAEEILNRNNPDDRFKAMAIATRRYIISPGYNLARPSLYDGKGTNNIDIHFRSIIHVIDMPELNIPIILDKDINIAKYETIQKSFYNNMFRVEGVLDLYYKETEELPIWFYSDTDEVYIVNALLT